MLVYFSVVAAAVRGAVVTAGDRSLGQRWASAVGVEIAAELHEHARKQAGDTRSCEYCAVSATAAALHAATRRYSICNLVLVLRK